MIRSLCPILLLALASACDGSREGDVSPSAPIDGRWSAAAAEMAGQKFPDEVRKSIRLVVEDGTYTVTVGGAPDQGTVRLDPSTTPKSMDVTGTQGPNQGRTFLAIYETTGDTLRICYDLSGQSRPTEFATSKGSHRFLVTYEREKP